MNKIKNYIAGSWIEGDGEELVAENAINGAAIGTVSSAGLDYAAMLDYGRFKGGPALRKMTFQERGRMLKALALHLMSIKQTVGLILKVELEIYLPTHRLEDNFLTFLML